MDLEKKPVVLVTGCSSGIGKSIAALLHQINQFRVIATVRSLSSSASLKKELPENGNFLIRELDITNHQQRESLIADIFHQWKSIDILINNAGISYRSVIEHMDDEAELKQLDVNYLSPLALIRLVVPSMREQGHGKIINISSVSGMVAMPTMASYSASKHALEGATEALWYELRPYGISVSLLQPGFVHSNSFERVYYSKKAALSRDLVGPYAEYYQNMEPFVRYLMNLSPSTPNGIAEKILKIINDKNPPLWISATPDADLFFWIRKILPRRLFHKLMYVFLPKSKEWGQSFKKQKKQAA
ncbi:SDR family oxidoreductase [bacterium]|nr:SDR family oxidoreductase [bacterium]